MKNITLLALGIFIGAVGVIYGFGSMSVDKKVAENPVFSSDVNSSTAPALTKTSGPVSSPKLISTPTASENPNSTPLSTPVLTPNSTPVPTNSKPALTRNEIAKHSTQNDCYLIVNNKVYNISSYFGSHPGGDSIMRGYCGTEASGIFADIHSNYAWDLLSKYFIGNLATG